MYPVERSGFTMDMPKWEVETDQDGGARGRYAVTRDSLRAEVAWSLDGDADIAALDTAMEGVQRGYEMERVERRVERPPGQLRLFGMLDFGGKGWFAMTQIACRESGVLATFIVSGPQRDSVEHLRDRMLDTFQCRAAGLPRLTEAWPSTDLPAAFGVSMAGSPVLAHRDGRWILIGQLAPDTIENIGADIERAVPVFNGYGHAVGTEWIPRGPASEIENLSGTAFSWLLDSAVLGPVAASAFACPGGALGYILFAGDDAGRHDGSSLQALSARFGCPARDRPSVLDRPTACEAGVADFCDVE